MPRRILLLITDLEVGGTPTVVRELAVRLRDEPRVGVEVACLGKWGPVADQLRDAGVTVTALGARGAHEVWVVRKLAELVRERGIDTVVSFLVHANAIAAATAPGLAGVRFFQSIQTTQASPAWHWRVQRFVHHAAERVIVPSPSVARVATERAKVPAEKLLVIPNAIDPAAFDASPIPARDPRPYPIGFVGRLDPVKMVPDLVAAAASLGDLVHLHVFGDGAERATIERAIRVGCSSRRVTMWGTIHRPQEGLERIGLLVLPSISEGFGLVLIEAMAAGVPVIARDVPGVRDVVRDGQTGLLVKSLLVPDLARAIESLVRDPAARDRLTDAARRDVPARFAWPAVLRQYRDALGIR